MSYRIRSTCRACGFPFQAELAPGTKSLHPDEPMESILNLGVMPLPNAFRKPSDSRPGHYPVELLACPKCHLGQLSAVVDPVVLYSDYPYVTSPSQMMSEHFDALFSALSEHRKIETVLEIGSNDGLCLARFLQLGASHVTGIDPAENLVKLANARGVNTICSMFDRQAAEMARAALPAIDLVLARHVFCHIDDWDQFINNVSVLCDKETVVCIEVPYAQDMIEKCEWDTIYAEHTSYLTLKAVDALLELSGLWLQDVIRFPIHGGAIALILRRRDSAGNPTKRMLEMMLSERCELTHWKAFAQRAHDQIANLKLLVGDLRSQGKRVCGYGASAKATQWINACGFTKNDIYGVYDGTPQKLYTTIPGTNIPVIHEGAFFADAADYAVLWAWNYESEIVERQKKWAAGGGKWIVPVPEVRIVS